MRKLWCSKESGSFYNIFCVQLLHIYFFQYLDLLHTERLYD